MGFEEVDKNPLNGDSDSDAERTLKFANIFYMIVFVVFAIICFILYNTGSSWIGKIINTAFKLFSDNKYLIGTTLVARTTSVLAIWFLIHAIVTINNKSLQEGFQYYFHISWKSVHVLVLVLLWVGFWFIGDGFFNFYVKFAMYISVIYMLIQILFLVIFFNDLNDKWASDENMCWLLTATIVMTVVGLVGYGLAYWMFKNNMNQTIVFVTVNLLISVALFILSIFIEHGSIFTSSLVLCYMAYLTWAGLMCEQETSSSGAGIAFSVISSIFTLIWAGYSALTSSNQFIDCKGEESTDPEFSLSFFHLMFAAASIYVTMIVTHWGQTDTNSPWSTSRGTVAKWVNMTSAWIVALLYLWILIAPYVCKNRDFS